MTTQAELNQDWEVFGTGLTDSRDSVYSRDSVAGETFNLPYQKTPGPVIIHSTAEIPEPSAVVVWVGLVLVVALTKLRLWLTANEF